MNTERRIGYYPRLAADGIRKNKRLYLPYLLTCVGMVMMTYLISYLEYAEDIAVLPGGNTIQSFMGAGVVVLLLFATLFLFYTNSFLIKRRKKEFGLYHVLGMGKGNLGRILFWESVYIAVLALVLGLVFGVAFSKLFELGLANLLKGQVAYSFSLSVQALALTALSFAAIFTLLFLNALRQIWFSSAVSLLRSENAGEKPPRANGVVGLLGVVLLGAAYYLAVTIRDPVSAIAAFVVAVLLVILATYLIMIAGSVLFCRLLQRRKSYYYRSDHFVSVSSMVYRMKRNGAGLASICILATMVLVMISSTSALFIGGEDVLRNRYPREINAWFRMHGNREVTGEDQAMLQEVIDRVLDEHNAVAEHVMKYHSTTVAGMLHGGDVVFDSNEVNDLTIGRFSDVHQFYLVPLEDYNAMMGRQETLAEDEVLIFAPRNTFSGDTFGFAGQKRYRVKEILKDCFLSPDASIDIVPSLMVIVPDLEEASEGLIRVETDDAGGTVVQDFTYKKWYYCFDTDLGKEEELALWRELKDAMRSLQLDGQDTFLSSIQSREYERQDFYSLYGGLFYLGIILSIVFIFAAVLIIYYKQISEGYEDQSRFEIMQKVGMTKRDIRRSVNSQLLTVFFLPLAGAGLHLAFAFPIIERLLLLFNLNNHLLFLCTTIGSFLVFALFYAIVYRMTSNAYYQIVSGAKGGE